MGRLVRARRVRRREDVAFAVTFAVVVAFVWCMLDHLIDCASERVGPGRKAS